MSDDLKPCPFCGKTPEIIKKKWWDSTEYTVACINSSCPCEPRTLAKKSEESAMSEWNRREGKA